MLNVPVNNFSVILGRGHRFLGITSTLGEGGGVNMSCSRTQHGYPSGARTPTSGSGVRGVNHQATAPLSQRFNLTLCQTCATYPTIIAPRHVKTGFLYNAKTKTQFRFAVTAKLISAFVFATRIMQFLFLLNPKF